MTAPPSHQNASLYCGDLPSDVTEATLFELFKAVGPVLSIRVCRDAVTRQSLGYAYVNFQNPTDAERALETLNYHPMKGKPIRIMWSHRDPSLRKSASGNIFIKNLHKTIDNQTLYDTFSQFGNILSCKVALDQSGESRGYGFVHFESEDSAKAAIEKVNSMLLKSLQVFVGRFVPHSQRVKETLQTFTNVYVKDMKADVTEEEIKSVFGRFGEITSFAMRFDKTGRPFAFVNFASHQAAADAIEKLNGSAELTNEGNLYCSRFQSKSERFDHTKKLRRDNQSRWATDSGSNLYVKNLDDSMGDEELKAAFSKFGEISSVKVERFDNGQSKGFGFVNFADVESANKAINEMNGQTLFDKPLYVNVAQRRDVRRAALEMQYSSRMLASSGPSVQQQGSPLGYPPTQMYNPSAYPPYSPFMSLGGAAGGRGEMPPRWFQQQQQQIGFSGMGFPPQQQMGMRAPIRRFAPVAAGRGAAGMAVGGRGGAMSQVGGYAYTPQARNKDVFPVVGGQQPVVMPVSQMSNGVVSPLSAGDLSSMSSEQQKNALGERLFAKISETHPTVASKVTGMLLEMGVPEALNLLVSPQVLHSKIEEALEVLKAHSVVAEPVMQ